MIDPRQTPLEPRQRAMMRDLLAVAAEAGDLSPEQQDVLERTIDDASTVGDLQDVMADLDRCSPGAATRAVEATVQAASPPVWRQLLVRTGFVLVALVATLGALRVLESCGVR